MGEHCLVKYPLSKELIYNAIKTRDLICNDLKTRHIINSAGFSLLPGQQVCIYGIPYVCMYSTMSTGNLSRARC
jgi:hypothetical protein